MVEYSVLYYIIYSAIISLEGEYPSKNISLTLHEDHRISINTNRTTRNTMGLIKENDLYFKCLDYRWNIIRIIFNQLICLEEQWNGSMEWRKAYRGFDRYPVEDVGGDFPLVLKILTHPPMKFLDILLLNSLEKIEYWTWYLESVGTIDGVLKPIFQSLHQSFSPTHRFSTGLLWIRGTRRKHPNAIDWMIVNDRNRSWLDNFELFSFKKFNSG